MPEAPPAKATELLLLSVPAPLAVILVSTDDRVSKPEVRSCSALTAVTGLGVSMSVRLISEPVTMISLTAGAAALAVAGLAGAVCARTAAGVARTAPAIMVVTSRRVSR